MLVLSRKLGEKTFIGDDIVVTVVDIDRGKIRLGIEAPREVPISRDRPWEKIDKEVEADLKELQGDKPATF